jgi:hypothetical protein
MYDLGLMLEEWWSHHPSRWDRLWFLVAVVVVVVIAAQVLMSFPTACETGSVAEKQDCLRELYRKP